MKLSHLTPLFWLAAFLFAGEVALEARANRRGFDTLLFGSRAADTPGTATGYGPTGEFPFRSPIRETPADGLTVWVASSSYGEDPIYPIDSIFPNRLAPLLEASLGRPVVVLNRSRAGIGIPVNLHELRAGAAAWDPDLVLLYQLTNDLGVLSDPAQRFLPVLPPDAEPGPRSPRDHIRATWERTTLFQLMRGNATPLLTAQRMLPERIDPVADSIFRSRIEEFVDLVREVGATPVLVTMATSAADPDDIPPVVRLWTLQWAPNLSPEAYLRTLRRWNDDIRAVAAQRGVPLVDLEAALAGRPELFRDFAHFNEVGHRVAAEVIAARIAGGGEGAP